MSDFTAQDTGFWTWQIDRAAAARTNNRIAIGSGAVYAVGALMMLVPVISTAPAWVAMAGGLLIALSVAACLGLVAKVLMQRHHIAGT